MFKIPSRDWCTPAVQQVSLPHRLKVKALATGVAWLHCDKSHKVQCLSAEPGSAFGAGGERGEEGSVNHISGLKVSNLLPEPIVLSHSRERQILHNTQQSTKKRRECLPTMFTVCQPVLRPWYMQPRGKEAI